MANRKITDADRDTVYELLEQGAGYRRLTRAVRDVRDKKTTLGDARAVVDIVLAELAEEGEGAADRQTQTRERLLLVLWEAIRVGLTREGRFFDRNAGGEDGGKGPGAMVVYSNPDVKGVVEASELIAKLTGLLDAKITQNNTFNTALFPPERLEAVAALFGLQGAREQVLDEQGNLLPAPEPAPRAPVGKGNGKAH